MKALFTNIFRSGKYRLGLWVAGISVAALLMGAGGAAAAMHFDAKQSQTLFQGVTVGGISLDGMHFGAAKQRLVREFESPLDQPLTIQASGQSFDTTPRQLGASTNVLSVYQKAVSIDDSMTLLRRVWHRLTGASVDRRFPVATNLDPKKIEAVVQRIAKTVDRPAKNASFELVGDGIQITDEAPGYTLDRRGATEMLKTVAVSPGFSAELEGKALRPAVTRDSFKSILVVKVGENKLYHYNGDQLVKVYGVAPGMTEFPTPIGRFRIVNKRFQPTWVNPAKAPGKWGFDLPDKIPPGPGNPLGTRAMDLNVSGIRIHGSYAAKSIGFNASHGCIRMRISDVEELFERVSVGTPVVIVRNGPDKPMPASALPAVPVPMAESDGTAVPGVGAAPPPPPPPAPAPAPAPAPLASPLPAAVPSPNKG